MNRIIKVPLCLLVVLTVLGCNFMESIFSGDNKSESESTESVETGAESFEIETEAVSQGGEETATEIAVTHTMQPGEPVGDFQIIQDQVSANNADENRAPGGDNFQMGQYERPFLQDMTYLPLLDIKSAGMNRFTPAWIYLRIELMGDPHDTQGDQPLYGLELDMDGNNRGEYLILARLPADDNWTTDGVQIWYDLDKKVGGATPVKPDAGDEGNGYEKLLFDQGQASDPDMAWVRISPTEPNTIEIAFKVVLINGIGTPFVWLPWTLQGVDDPALFEFNDHFTPAQAGSPLKNQKNYPLNDLWGIDNTCRGLSGFTSPKDLIGVCSSEVMTPSSPGSPGQPPVLPGQPGGPGGPVGPAVQ